MMTTATKGKKRNPTEHALQNGKENLKGFDPKLNTIGKPNITLDMTKLHFLSGRLHDKWPDGY